MQTGTRWVRWMAAAIAAGWMMGCSDSGGEPPPNTFQNPSTVQPVGPTVNPNGPLAAPLRNPPENPIDMAGAQAPMPMPMPGPAGPMPNPAEPMTEPTTDPMMMDPMMMDPMMMDPMDDALALPPVTDYTDEGPFSTTMESSTGPGRGYTIFRPDPLGEDGFMHPPIIFGPGILTSPTNYRNLLTHLATHGYVTIVVNSLGGGPGSPANVEAMKEGLEWLIAQNDEAGDYQGKLAVDRATTMGYSLGATASVQLSSHPAIATTVAIHGHNTSGDPHGPVWLLTGEDDVIDSVRSTLGTLDEAPAIMTALPIGHLAVLSELSATGRYVGPITAWLRYWINGDEDAKQVFWGDACGMCASPWSPPETNSMWDAQGL